MSSDLVSIITAAGGILLAAVVISVFRAGLSLRDNTSAIRGLTKDVNEWRHELRGEIGQIERRVKNIEDWRIASEAARISSSGRELRKESK